MYKYGDILCFYNKQYERRHEHSAARYISVNICFFSKGEDGAVNITPSSLLLNKAVKRTGNSNNSAS